MKVKEQYCIEYIHYTGFIILGDMYIYSCILGIGLCSPLHGILYRVHNTRFIILVEYWICDLKLLFSCPRQ